MKTFSCRNALLSLVCAGLLGGCASKSDMETLQNQAYRDRQESRKTIQRLEEELAKSQEVLREDIQKSTSPVQARQANTWAELEALRVQVAKQQEKLETLTMKFNALTSAQGEGPSLADTVRDVQNIKVALQSQFGLELDSTPTAAVAAAPADAAVATADKAKAATKTETAKPKAAEEPKADPKTNTADALFAKAEAAFKAKKYEEASQYYSEFATAFKKHPNTSQAVFWVGECAYNLQDYGKAVLAYQEVIEKYPRSTKYKPAVLKQGMAFFKIGKDKAGRAVLQDLIDRFPKDPEATVAKKFLKEHK
ncbi:MAG: tetratricopeptide repeat protein [Humidesulfovibrio sp.]|uniref:tetratricopeptide repeat protein n=1 Tax=Humidesulfovibrio sp. TaxID=2910988 RepID=UPI0027F23DB7|nr:tetratricopeptide repeat protein [Humidesulfovibrio sp.]MDQ7834051.1 tetratricopeptide repeat protein [Humidesulfovibrio sp.]